MAALPYMQFYPSEYLADTQHLSGAQHGAYLLLMMNYWTRGKALMDSDERLCLIARTELTEWKDKIRPALEEFFTIGDGMWFHGRIEKDLEAVTTKCERASKAGKASAQRKSNERSTTVEIPLNQNSTKRIEENRREENKEQAPPFIPTADDKATLVAKRLQAETSLKKPNLQHILKIVAMAEVETGIDERDVFNAMSGAWCDFQLAKPSLAIHHGAETFYGEGMWKDKSSWPWKDGHKPVAKRKYL